MLEIESTVEGHYSTEGLLDRVREAVKASGLDWDALTAADLGPIDHFHIRGRDATLEMLSLAQFKPEMTVLDVGCGLGGPARALAAEVGCQVHGVDLTDDFIETAKALTEKTGLSDRATFECCSVLDLPQESASFDGVLMQHLNMNIADKPRLFSELARVLRPGGTLAMHEILADRADQPYFPVPWASAPEGSFMCQESEFLAHLADAGFTIGEFRDVTQESTDWFGAVLAKTAESGPPKMGLHVLLGPRFGEMAKNTYKSLSENRVKVVMAVCKRA